MNRISDDIFFTLYTISVFAVSLVLYQLFNYFSHSFGVREYQKTEVNRWNPNYKPSVGGFVFYVVFLFTVIFSTLIFGIDQKEKIKIIGIWGAVTIAFFMGFADDTFNTQPIIKFTAQLSCGLILILTGTHIQIFEYPIVNHFLTIFWVVGIMNSINMLDNMDGIAASVSLYIFIFILLIMYFSGVSLFSIQFLIILGVSISLIAFLFFNFYPSKIFMGDTGSQFLGVLLALAGIEHLWNLPVKNSQTSPIIFHLLIIVLVYIILITDTTTVTINRILAGGSPFVGGKDHTTHFLCKRGFSERQVFLILFSISMLSLFFAFQLIFNYAVHWVYTSILFIFFSFLSLYLNTKIFRPEKK